MSKEIYPDKDFRKSLKRLSGSDLGTCIQCGTCSVVCSLAPDDSPFPRKEMIWAGWGLKDRLIGNCDVWLCHQCGDCSAHCPRGVQPANVIAAVRTMTYRYYARPAFLGKIVSSPSWLPLAILIPVVIIALILIAAGTFSIPDGPVDYSRFFPHTWLNVSFTLLTALSWSLATRGFIFFHRDMKAGMPDSRPVQGLLKSLLQVIGQLMRHSNFSGCSEQKSRKTAHLLVFYGFALLLLVTVYAVVATITGQYPLRMDNPFKLLGNAASVMMLTGLGIMIINRLGNKTGFGRSDYSDWMLLISILLLTISGSLTQFARSGDWDIAYHLYFFHLVCVWFVIIYMPYTKFGHIIYRTFAMSFARSVGRV